MAAQQSKIQTRAQRHTKAKNGKSSSKGKTAAKGSTNLFPLLIIAFALIALITGAFIGYSVIGDGEPVEIFNLETWTHLYNLIFE